MKMAMTDGEILTSYRKARDPEAQIGILADLNDCRVGEIREKLTELGVELPTSRKRKRAAPANKKAPMDELRAMALYNEGLCDLEIAESLGETQFRVAEWRRRMHLKAHRKSRAEQSAAFFEGPPDEAAMETEEGETVIKQLEEAPDGTTMCNDTASATADAVTPSPQEEGFGEAPDEPAQMTLGTLIRVLQEVESGFPDGKVLVCGSDLTCVDVTVAYGRTGAVEDVTVMLFG